MLHIQVKILNDLNKLEQQKIKLNIYRHKLKGVGWPKAIRKRPETPNIFCKSCTQIALIYKNIQYWVYSMLLFEILIKNIQKFLAVFSNSS